MIGKRRARYQIIHRDCHSRAASVNATLRRYSINRNKV
jgi:hypothetical protein